jgi:hypothetical protein
MRAALATALLAAALAGCRARTPTYHQDVAPILAQQCRDCHHAGGVAPVPPLDSYANVRIYAQTIRMAVQTRQMPPWGADNTGLCGTWYDARWLTSDEISTVARWQQAGAPEGEPVPPPPIPTLEEPLRADATVDIGGSYRPGLGAGGNRCFVADPRLDRDRLLTALRVVSADARAVAQVTLFALDTPESEAKAAALDQAAPGLGYPCYGTARVDGARLVASWTWPKPVLRMPQASGVRLHAGRKLVVQIHYDISHTGSAFAADTHVDLELEDHAREAQLLAVRADGTLTPGQTYVAVEAAQPVERKLRVLGVAPRMHIRGDTMRLTVERGGKSTCLADFDHWHSKAQQLFRARQPALLEPGDRLHLSCSYNTQGRAKPVTFGDDIDDEECVAYLLVGE